MGRIKQRAAAAAKVQDKEAAIRKTLRMTNKKIFKANVLFPFVMWLRDRIAGAKTQQKAHET